MCRSSLLSVSVSSSSRSWFERSTRRLPLPNASSESCGPYISKVRKQFEIENFPTSCLMCLASITACLARDFDNRYGFRIIARLGCERTLNVETVLFETHIGRRASQSVLEHVCAYRIVPLPHRLKEFFQVQ